LYLLNKELSSSPRNPLPDLLYSSIISAIGNVVDFMVGTSEFVGIEPAQGACQLRACSPEHLLKKAMSEEHWVLPVATLLALKVLKCTMAVQNYSNRGKSAIGEE
jgi:hypothetical protein